MAIKSRITEETMEAPDYDSRVEEGREEDAVVTEVFKYTSVGKVRWAPGENQTAVEAAMLVVAKDLELGVYEGERKAKVVELYEFTIDGVSFKLDAVVETPAR